MATQNVTTDTGTATSTPSVTADFGSLRCPLLGLKTMGVLRKLEKGQTAEIATLKEGAERPLFKVALMTRTRIVRSEKRGGRFHHLFRKA